MPRRSVVVNFSPTTLARKFLKKLNLYICEFCDFCGSNHIDAGAFHFVEESEAEEDEDEADNHAGADLPKVNSPLPHEGETEGFNDEDHGV
jgi:hypothetical protein